MKKAFIILFVIILSLNFAGCQFNNSPQNDSNNSSEYVFDTVLYKSESELFTVVEDEDYVDFDAEVFVDKAANQTINLQILNNEYTAKYVESVKLPLCGETVHTYSLSESSNIKVLIDATGKIVKYINLPINTSLSTEQEYKDFIQNLVGETVKLSKYDYKCTTWHYIFSDNGMESKVEDGFHICGDNERFSSFSFFFDKSINGINSLEHISAEFTNDSFTLEIYDWGYETEPLAQLLQKAENIENIENVDDQFSKFFNDHTKKGYFVKEYEIRSQKLFFRNGILYLYSSLDIVYADSLGEEYDSVVNVLSGYFKANESKQ